MTLKNKHQTRLKKWFGSRMPIADEVILQQRSTYILPTKAGFFMLLIVIVMMVGATNYQNNLAFLLTFLVVGIGLVSILFTFKNLQGLIFSRGVIKSVCAGENIEVVVRAASQSNQNHLTIGTGFSKQTLFYCDVNIEKHSKLILSYKTNKRGWCYLPRIMSTSSFPFGLLKVWTWFKFETPVLVYPQAIQPPVVNGMTEGDEKDGGKIMSGVEELYGVKNYQAGDLMSRIDWKALAREKGLFTKEFVAFQSASLSFNWNDFLSVNDEIKLSYLCYLVKEASLKQLEFSMVLPNIKIKQSSGTLHLKKCLEALALFGYANIDELGYQVQ